MKLSEQLTAKENEKTLKLKKVVSELSKYQDLLFKELVGDLGIRDAKIEEFLFDFCYNDSEISEFSEYLKDFGQ